LVVCLGSRIGCTDILQLLDSEPRPEMTTLRVAVADDHPVVRAGLKILLDSQPDISVVGDVADGPAAVRAAIELQPDVFIMDICLPLLGGAEATEQIRKACPAVRVLALTAHDNIAYAQLLLKAGAAGYVSKRAAAEELIRAVRALAAGGVYLDPGVAGQLVFAGARGSQSRQHGAVADLSEREAEVVRLIAQGHVTKEIAVRLQLSTRTLETYKARAMEKLGLSSRADIVRYALQRGWLKGD
jgi:DNA-binding NarL/FixJ family response regulator